MERSQRRFHGAAAVLSSLMLWWSDVVVVGSMAAVTTSSSTAAVPVGVVLDLTSDTGRRNLVRVSMALEDFYAEHPHFATRVGVHVRDSRGDIDTATHAVEDLLKNDQVQAIIVAPQTSAEADLFANLSSRNRILVLSFSDISPTLLLRTAPFFVHTAVKESFQIVLIAGIITSFSWHEVIVMCEGLPYGSGILQPPSDVLQSNKARTVDSVDAPIGVTDDHIVQVLYRLKEKPARRTVHLFSRAKHTGMITEDYVTGKGAVGVCSWTQFYLLPQNLRTEGSSSYNSRSSSGTVKPVFWQEDSVMASKGHEKISFTCSLETKPSVKPEARSKTRRLEEENLGKMCGGLPKVPLKIGVPWKDGFKEFVNVSPPYLSCSQNNPALPSTTEQIIGYSIDFFKAAMMKLQLDPRCYEFCVHEGSYDELVRDVSLGNLDGAVGDVTITSERTKVVDFTMPYTHSGVYLLVLGENDLEPIQWIFVAPLTWKLWLATVGFFFFTGFVVWMIERPRNPVYQGSILRQISTASYFAFSTLTFSHDQIIRSPLSKIVVVVWCFVVLILVQSYTASLSSMLTAERLRPSVTDLEQLLKNDDNVGYQNGSFVGSILRNQDCNESRLFEYSSKVQYAEALRKGSKNGGVSAIVEEIPFLTSFLSDPQYQKEFQIVKTIYKTPGFGFAFPLGFPLLHNLSTAILNVTGGDEGSQIEAKWLGTDSLSSSSGGPNTDSTPLTLQSFSGLFITSGCISLAMLLVSIGKLLRARWTKARNNNVQSIGNHVFDEESHSLHNSTSNVAVADQHHPEARNDGNQGQGAHRSGESGGVEESHPIRNDMGSSSARDQLNEAISDDSQGVRRSCASARFEERSSELYNGFVSAQSLQIDANNV